MYKIRIDNRVRVVRDADSVQDAITRALEMELSRRGFDNWRRDCWVLGPGGVIEGANVEASRYSPFLTNTWVYARVAS